MKILTLVIIHQHPNILLGMKKRGFGAGMWNGFGGKVEEGESIEEAAARELQEEAGLVADNLEKRGVVEFAFEGDPNILQVHIFCSTEYQGEPMETEEMRPQWFDVNKIPFAQMWPDDIHWMPYFLAGKYFTGRFLFDRPSTPEYMGKILEMEVSG